MRSISFYDKVREKWPKDQRGVLVDEVKPGGWAALGHVNVGDLLLEIDGATLADVDAFERVMQEAETAKPDVMVLCALRGIHMMYLELEPKWEADDE